MKGLRAFLLRFTGLFQKGRRDRELAAEMQSHLQMHIEDNLRRGMTPDEARREALIKLGGVEQTKETYRARRGLPMLETLAQDVRYGLRVLRKSPGFTAVAVLTLALGIGANTTILSVVSSMLLRKPPVPNPDGLLAVTSKNPVYYPADPSLVSAADYLDWREQASDFSGIAAASFDDFTISGQFTTEFVQGARISVNFLQIMEVQPIIGRALLPGEGQPGKDRAVLLGNRLWKEKFAGDPRVLGQSLKINGNRYTVVGVMPEKFDVSNWPAQIWFPLVFSPDELGPGKRGVRFLRVYARLKAGVPMSEAIAQMTAIAQRLAQAHPDTNKGWGARVMTEQQYMVSDWNATRALFVLMMAVGLVLLLACANVASMLLARNSSRVTEFSIRAALGAGRLRLVRQLLTECLLLSLAGGALGILFAYWGVRGIVSQFNWKETVLEFGKTVGIDSRVLVFTAAISFLVAIVVGIAPAVRLSRRDPGERLQQSARGTTATRQRHRLQRVLVVAQISLSLILLTGAGLFVQEFVAETRAATGLNSQNVLTASVYLRGLQYYAAPQRQSLFFQDALRKIGESPRVESVAVTSTLPFDFPDSARFVIEGHSVLDLSLIHI